MAEDNNFKATFGIKFGNQMWNGDINFDNPTVLATINARSKRQADLKLDYMESFMIKLPKTGFNADEGRRVSTKQWDPRLIQLRKKMGIGAPLWLSTSLFGERGGGINSLSWMFFGHFHLTKASIWCLCVQSLCLRFILSHSWMMVSQSLSKYSVDFFLQIHMCNTQMKNSIFSSNSPYVQWL